MKNGYIIQGPVVKHNSESVVLGWSNGKVIIPRRFIDTVVLDPEEREPASEDSPEAALPESGELIESNIPLEAILPEDFNEFVGDVISSPKPPAGDPTPPVEVEPIEKPAPDPSTTVTGTELGAAVQVDELGLSIRPPEGWTPQGDKGFALVGQAEPNGFVPSFRILKLEDFSAGTDELRRLLREEQAAAGFELVEEGEHSVGFEIGFHRLGKKLQGDREVFAWQLFVRRGADVYLISAFSSEALTGATLTAVHAALATLDWVAPTPAESEKTAG